MPVSFFMVRRRVPSRMACTCKLKSSKAEAPATMCRIVVARRERDAVNSVVGYRARCRQQVARPLPVTSPRVIIYERGDRAERIAP